VKIEEALGKVVTKQYRIEDLIVTDQGGSVEPDAEEVVKGA
jgi:hypothetical protein